jgi:heme exporter protein B
MIAEDLHLFSKLFKREWLVQIRQKRFLVNSSLFFVMILFIFPLTLNADVALLKAVSPGVIWMAVLLSLLISSERLFQQDFEHGVLEQWLVSGHSLALMLSAKILVNWLVTLLPLVLITPLIAILFSFSLYEAGVLLISLFLGTPALVFLCALSAAFSLGINQRGALMALILLPLTVPILIFASGTLNRAMQGLAVNASYALLGAISLLVITFMPYALAAVIRIGEE